MCGIAGILSFNNKKARFENVALMTEAMRRRGPDDEGYAFFTQSGEVKFHGGNDTPSSVYNGTLPYQPKETFQGFYPEDTILAFGHRRLSIIDLSDAGHQPMCLEGGRYWITYNGEIYNYLELRHELEKDGESFVSHSDTEVILKAYRRWGPDCLRRFNGMWAFALWDNTERKLFCARDRIGIKPFYYYRTGDFFLFASDIKTLIASKLYHPEINYEGLWHNLSFSIAPRPMTCFKDVLALEQAHWMMIDASGTTRKQRFWDIPIGTQVQSMKEQEAVELLEYELTKAIKYQLIADVDVGTFMSGGIDSTTVSAIASRLHPGIKAFTLGFDKSVKEFDELDQAIATAEMHPMEHIVRRINPLDIVKDIPDMIRCAEEPSHILPPNFTISKLVSENKIKVVMNGLGGDELFAGYGHYKSLSKWELLRYFKSPLVMVPKGIHRKIDTAKRMSTSTIGEFYAFCYSAVDDEDKKKLFDINQTYDSIGIIAALYNTDDLKFTDNVEALSFYDMNHYIGNHHVYRVDQYCMHHSIEGRFPFLDHHFIEAAFKIPTRYKMKDGLQKYVLRKVAQPYIHPTCLAMDKKGFGLPSGRWFENELKSLGDESLHYLTGSGIFKKGSDIMGIVNKNKQKYILLALWHRLFWGDKGLASVKDAINGSVYMHSSTIP